MTHIRGDIFKVVSPSLPVVGPTQTRVEYSFGGNIPPLTTENVDLPVPSANRKNEYLYLHISTGDNAAIHQVWVSRIEDLWIFFISWFRLKGSFDLKNASPGSQARISMYNGHATNTIFFTGTIYWLDMPI